MTRKRLDLELTVGAFQGSGVLEHHHAGDVIRAGEIRDIVAFDILRELLESQKILQLVQHAELSARHAAELSESFIGVFLTHIDQILLRSPLRDVEINAPALLLRQPQLGVLHVLDLAVDRDVRGDLRAQGIVAQEELGTKIDLVVHIVDDEILGIVEPRFVEAEHGSGAFIFLTRDGDDVQLVEVDVHDLLLVAQLLHRRDLITITRGALKVQRLCRGGHTIL